MLTYTKTLQSSASIYLSSNNVKPLLGTWTYVRQAAEILEKLKIKKGGGCNQYTTTKDKISEDTV